MPSDDSSWILSLIVMEQYNGEPGALRGACPVLREDCANLPPKGGKAALSYSTLPLVVPCIPVLSVGISNMFLFDAIPASALPAVTCISLTGLLLCPLKSLMSRTGTASLQSPVNYAPFSSRPYSFKLPVFFCQQRHHSLVS